MTTLHSVPRPDEPPLEPRPRVARFGIFDLDLHAGELRRSGIRVPLQDQPVRLLAFLLEHAGEVVTREEVRDRLWPAEFVDFDHSLNTAVRKLRAALDDSADNPRFIETLSRRGYRFIAPVSWNVEPATKPVPVVPEPRVRSNVPAIVIALLALAIVAGGLALFRR
ncbi:MAG: winged helix-turn-helix domain-containing protein, partial [Thermoanaerobaculia bacterium]